MKRIFSKFGAFPVALAIAAIFFAAAFLLIFSRPARDAVCAADEPLKIYLDGVNDSGVATVSYASSGYFALTSAGERGRAVEFYITSANSVGAGWGHIEQTAAEKSDGRAKLYVSRAGDMTVSARYEGDSGYETALGVTVGKARQNPITFWSASTTVFGETYLAVATGGTEESGSDKSDGTGGIKYEVVTKAGTANEGTAAFSSPDVGYLNVSSAGNVWLRASRTGGTNYYDVYEDFLLEIARAPQPAGFKISKISGEGDGNSLVWGRQNDFPLSVSGAGGTGAVTYKVTEGTGKAEVQTVGGASYLRVTRAGAFVLTATKAADQNYKEGAATMNVTVELSGMELVYSKLAAADAVSPDDYGRAGYLAVVDAARVLRETVGRYMSDDSQRSAVDAAVASLVLVIENLRADVDSLQDVVNEAEGLLRSDSVPPASSGARRTFDEALTRAKFVLAGARENDLDAETGLPFFNQKIVDAARSDLRAALDRLSESDYLAVTLIAVGAAFFAAFLLFIFIVVKKRGRKKISLNALALYEWDA